MKKKLILNVLIVVFGLTFLISAGLIVKALLEYKRAGDFYNAARSDFFELVAPSQSSGVNKPVGTPSAAIPEDEPTPEPEPAGPADLVKIDFDAIRAINPDVYAWIWIPDTDISYPVLQGDSNWTYLGKTYDMTPSNSGSIFIDYKNSPDFSDRNTVIYGHNMQSGDMFGSLKKYSAENYRSEHPYFYIFMPGGYKQYEIFCSAVTRFDSSVYTFRFSDDDAFSRHLQMLTGMSYLSLAEELSVNDNIVTLSTCTSGRKVDRFVVAGRLVADTTVNEEPGSV